MSVQRVDSGAVRETAEFGARPVAPGSQQRIAVVIPCYRVRSQVGRVIEAIGPEVERIYVVDDCCPEQTGRAVADSNIDTRVRVLFHASNRGVGGAVISGYRAALEEGYTIVVKIDGDGQMDPALLPRFVRPILEGEADYTKGNRFFELGGLREMPALRLFGNAVLSFVNKLTSGYWDVIDPTNGYTAIHRAALEHLPLEKIDSRYFFESDLLFRLGTIRAVVRDVPMSARYADESSSLRIRRVLFEFPPKYLARVLKRIFYVYFLRDFNAGTLALCAGLPLFLFGSCFGAYHLVEANRSLLPTPTGTIMMAVLPIILGVQLLLTALTFDIGNVPRKPISDLIR